MTKVVFTLAGGALLSPTNTPRDPRVALEKFNSLHFTGQAYRYTTRHAPLRPGSMMPGIDDVLTSPLSTEAVTYTANRPSVSGDERYQAFPMADSKIRSSWLVASVVRPSGDDDEVANHKHLREAADFAMGAQLDPVIVRDDLKFNTIFGEFFALNLKTLRATVSLPATSEIPECHHTSSWGSGSEVRCGGEIYSYQTAELACRLTKTR